MQADSLAIVIPTFNETETIGLLLTSLREVLPHCSIYVVDDSPHLGVQEVVSKLNLPAVHFEKRREKGGRGSAVLDGMKIAIRGKNEFFLEMDADFSHAPSEIPGMIQQLKNQNLDLIIGSRYLPESQILNWPMSRRLFSFFANWLARTLLRIPISDYTNGFRLYSLRGAQHITQNCGVYGKGFIALSEILVQVHCHGLKIGERPSRFVNRLRGESSVNFTELRNAFVGIFKIYYLKQKLSVSLRPSQQLKR